MNLGVDVLQQATPAQHRPGIGLRPGGERPDLEPLVQRLYGALFDAVAAHARAGVDVVVDVGLHDGYSKPLGILADAARRLAGLPVLLVGVRCPLDVIMQRRDAAPDGYLGSEPGGGVPEPVQRWQRAVHEPGIYDLEVDTSTSTPEQCAEAIERRLRSNDPPTALARAENASGVAGPRPLVTTQALIRHPDGRRILVSETPGAGFQRLFGGKVEHGELSHEALARELEEELGVTAEVGDLLGVLQNRFVYEGAPGHEVVFVHDVRLADERLYDRQLFTRVDRDDSVGIWRSLVDPPLLPLYAEGWQALLP